MRIRDNRGAVREVEQVIAAVEERRVFNGTRRRMLEPVTNMSVKPNALVFIFKDTNPVGMGCLPFPMSMGLDGKLLVGNLKSEVADRILADLTELGYADISDLGYQKEKLVVERYKFDNGASGAYCYTGYGIFQTSMPGCGAVNVFETECPDEADEDEKEDLSKFSDEGLREVLYELADYTFLQLGQMSREELENEYANQKGEP